MSAVKSACLVLVPLLALAACSGSDPAPATDSSMRIAVIPKGTTHVFWRSVEAGAEAAGRELGVEILWKGPLEENDRAQQIQLVQQFVSQKVSGIALAPLDHKALVAPVAQAVAAGIPVVIYDSDLDGTPGKDFASFVATNNRVGGELGGTHLAQLLGGKGKVVLLRYAVGSASTEQREQGFLDAIARAGGIEVLVQNQYAGATAGEAKSKALNLADNLRDAAGIFCSNESATNGMLLALRQLGLAKRARFVGFDASPPLLAALESGEIDALIVQDPRRMGALAVRTIVAVLRGEPVEPVIDTGVVLVTRENLHDAAIQELLK